jgi:lysozyme
LFQQDVQIAIDGCIAIYDNWEDLPSEIQHILINMCFQLGQGGLSKFKNMNSAVQEQAFSRMAEEMMDSRWARQTPERAERLRDRALALADA